MGYYMQKLVLKYKMVYSCSITIIYKNKKKQQLNTLHSLLYSVILLPFIRFIYYFQEINYKIIKNQ